MTCAVLLFFVQPTTRSGRAARAHTHFDLSTALPETKSARGARGVAPHTSPRHGTHRPATCRYLTGFAQADEEPPRSRRLDSTSRRPATTGRRALQPPPHLHHRQARASSDAPTKRPHGAQAIAAKPRHIGLTDGLPETYLRYVSGKKTSAATLDMATITPSSRLRPGPRTPRPGRAPSPATGGGPRPTNPLAAGG